MKYFHGACACIVRGLGRGHTSLERTVVRYFHNRCSAPLLSLRENFAGCRGGVKWRGPAIDNTGPPHNTAGPPHGPFMAILLDEERRGESLPRLWKISTDTRSNNEYSIHVLLSSHFWKIRFEKSERDLILSITSREYIYTSIKIRSPIYPILLEQNFSLETSFLLLLLPLRSSSGRSMRRMREREREGEKKSIARQDGPSNAISSITRRSCPTERRRQWRTAPIKKTSSPFLLSLDAAGGGGGVSRSVEGV